MTKIFILTIFGIILGHGYFAQAAPTSGNSEWNTMQMREVGKTEVTGQPNFINLLRVFKDIDFNKEAIVYLPKLFSVLENIIRMVTERGVEAFMDHYFTPILDRQLEKAEHYLKKNMQGVTVMQLIEMIPVDRIMHLIQPSQTNNNGIEKKTAGNTVENTAGNTVENTARNTVETSTEQKLKEINEFKALFTELKEPMMEYPRLLHSNPNSQAVAENIQKKKMIVEKMNTMAENSGSEVMTSIVKQLKEQMPEIMTPQMNSSANLNVEKDAENKKNLNDEFMDLFKELIKLKTAINPSNTKEYAQNIQKRDEVMKRMEEIATITGNSKMMNVMERMKTEKRIDTQIAIPVIPPSPVKPPISPSPCPLSPPRTRVAKGTPTVVRPGSGQ